MLYKTLMMAEWFDWIIKNSQKLQKTTKIPLESLEPPLSQLLKPFSNR